MLHDLWANIRGLAVAPPSPGHFTISLPEHDEQDLIADLEQAPEYAGEAISGFACILSYRDSRGHLSQRRITCQSVTAAGGQRYLSAFCHERRARRQFRIDRIVQVIDLHSGEISEEPLSFFESFSTDREQSSGLSWGLSVRQRADLIAGLNAMIFMGRCDDEWHPLECEQLERFVASFWIRHEIASDVPMADITAHAERLSPDAETFFIALGRCKANAVLGTIIRRQLQAMVDADGFIRAQELHWGSAVDRFLAA